ncbi:MAG: Long-chain-fatty-acid--CoA ligase [Candidatus Heimdallarchaeota archaeon LC_2]|nr:MAG: Long-chain-fatty-acid--CoA ligase [Candidatus Heimdallarchaeota archaeon LC_2]
MAEIEIPMPWIKTLEGVRKSSIEYQDISTYGFMKLQAETVPDQLSMIFGVKGGKSLTYSELLQNVKKMAVALEQKGVKHGSKIALMLPNTPHYVITHFALLALGATVVQTNPLYTGRELRHILSDSGATGIISITRFAPLINTILDDPESTLEWAVYGQIGDYMSPIIVFLGKYILRKLDDPAVPSHSKNFKYKDLLKSNDGSAFKEAKINLTKDLALLQYTGGTTGLSKGAALSYMNISANAQQARECIHMVPNGKGSVLTALPLFHSFALTSCLGLAIMLGVPMILVPNPREQLPTGEVHTLIEKHKITFVPGVPTLLSGLLNHPKAKTTDWSNVIVALSGGAGLPKELAKQFEKVTGKQVVEGYGLSETSPLLTINPIGHDTVKPIIGSIGLPAPDTIIRIANMDDTSKTMPLGENGEIVAKGPQVMNGYYNKPDENKNVIVDGWFLTGDVAYMDEQGFTYIVDRKKDMILVSGYNVYPLEVEQVLYSHPAVLEAAVAGLPHEVKGEIVAAWIILREGMAASEEDILKYCKENLAAYKVPKQITFRDELPTSLIGKILRRKLQEEAASS